jgi:hypothetical protein
MGCFLLTKIPVYDSPLQKGFCSYLTTNHGKMQVKIVNFRKKIKREPEQGEFWHCESFTGICSVDQAVP